ncbi:MAG: isopentenyl phosphate kinase family protein [Candidatus Bathyarchaeota archaeon]|nr:MAG: isopentenyl phosphate kinase [Candidatus Bathyarchaeum tardum]WNZ30316.1 MAG: isopentenyl phosphate kinase family protein [Candidatus Bathyarchaeota archaeon]
MTTKPTVLKLGGSVITEKNKPATPNFEAIERLAKEIAQANISSLILVHGGGSFGHPVAKKYHLTGGFGDASQIVGFSETHRAMTQLNSLVMEALFNNKVNAVVVQPSSCVVTKSGRIQTIELKPIKRMLDMGLIPVLYGDAVLDSEKGFAILSGDQLVSSLAINFDASRIVMGGDVDGLFTADPKTCSSAQLIPRVTLEELKSEKHEIEGSQSTDVTGGMLGKMRELVPAIEEEIETLIVNATKPMRVCKALKGEDVVGTVIVKG